MTICFFMINYLPSLILLIGFFLLLKSSIRIKIIKKLRWYVVHDENKNIELKRNQNYIWNT